MFKKLIIICVLSIFFFTLAYFISQEIKAYDRKNKSVIKTSNESSVKEAGYKNAKSEITQSDTPIVESNENEVSALSEDKIEPEIKAKLQKILNTSSDGLEEIVLEDGVMVDLEDRFMAAPVATINDDGEVTIRDYVAPPKN